MEPEKLNCAWVQKILKKAKLEISVSDRKDGFNDSRRRTLLNEAFKHHIRATLHRQLEFIKDKEPKWTLHEFLSLYVIFHIDATVSQLKYQISIEGEESKYENKNVYILNLKPSKSFLIKNIDFKPIKIKGVEAYYKNKEILLNFLLQEKNISKTLTPLNWIKLVADLSYKLFLAKKTMPEILEEELIVPDELRKIILYHHYKLDNKKADKGVFPVEIYSLKEALNFLKDNQDNFLAKCFLDNIGLYCKTSSYEMKKDSNYRYSSYSYFSLDNTKLSYIYFFEGLEQLHKKEPIPYYLDGSILCRPLRGDSPTKILCKSEIIHTKFGSSSLVVPLQLSLADICQGVTEKNFILKPEQQITPDDIYFLKSDIEDLKNKYFAKDDQEQLIRPILQDIETRRKIREKNKKFAQVASKRKKEKAKQRWEEPLDCALSIARDDPNHYFATHLARSVAKRKSIPGKLDTLRKKILKDKDIVKYLRQMKEIA